TELLVLHHPGDLAGPAHIAGFRMSEAELDVERAARLLACRLGCKIAPAIVGMNGRVPVVEPRFPGRVHAPEQPLRIAAEHLGTPVVVAMLDPAPDPAAEDDIVQVLHQRAEPPLALARGVLTVFLMGDVVVDGEQAAIGGRDFLAADPAVVDPALERAAR